MRMVIFLLNRPESETASLARSILNLKTHLKSCEICGNITENSPCSICANPSRDHSLICVVEDFNDLLAIENTSQFNGVYHVLGGLISPADGMGPADLNIEALLNRCSDETVKEVILALNATVEGDTTMFYLGRKLRTLPVLVTAMSRGIAVGAELEYTDEITLARSLQNRTPYQD